jgi:hypothetical protein
MPDKAETFSKDDPIHAQVIAALQIITGREFYLTQATTSSGQKIWVYRTEAKRHTSHLSDIMDMNYGKSANSPDLVSPVTSASAQSKARFYGALILGGIRENLGKREHPFGDSAYRVGAIRQENGEYIPVLDLYAEQTHDPTRRQLNAERVITLASTLLLDTNYKRPDYDMVDVPVTQAEKDLAELVLKRKESWVERIKGFLYGDKDKGR